MDNYVALHVHSEFSLLDGAAKIEPLFAEAARLGMPALAITDHGNMFGAAEFYRTAQRYPGVKPILGIEAYTSPASRHHKAPIFWGNSDQRKSDEYGEGGDVSGAGAYCHMTMLAENTTGLRKLFRLSSEASFTGFFRKPRMDRELIAQHSEGIIATTGCPSGEVQTRLRLGQYKEAMQAASDYRDIFGTDSYLVELMDHGLSIERSVREGLLDIGRQLGLHPVATNDSHYVTRDQSQAHDVLLCVQTGKTLGAPNRFRFEGEGYYLKSPAEMRAYWDQEVPGACDATLEIASRIESYAEVFAQSDRIPRFPVPDGETQETWLRREVLAGLDRLFPAGAPLEYLQRVDYELGVISPRDYSGYFLVTADIVRWARSQNIRVGPGRGSAAGSLVAYALGTTQIDPIAHGLLFERFLNPDRPSMPDIDLDFDDRRRGEVICYVTETWGSEYVAQIVTFGTIKTKGAIKDAARVLHDQRGFALASRITKALPPAIFAQDIPLSGITDPRHERYAEAGAIRALIESDPQVAEVMATAGGLEGLVRSVGVHASALILSAQPLLDVIPLWARDDGSLVTGWEMVACEDIGLLKMDLLGLRTLTVIDDALRAIECRTGVTVDLEALPLDDPAVYELMARGDTLGVFQLDGRAMRDLLIRMHPTCFPDISAALALYRPGPMAANAHNDYADRKNHRQERRPLHPELAEPLADILDETYGVIVFQEQVLAIVQRVAGYSLGTADLLRKAMGKKKRDVLDREYPRFAGGMRAAGYSDAAITALWDILVPFSSYAFGKGHTAAYAVIAYQTAYLKVHHPAEFMAALLTSLEDKKDRTAIYLAECRRIGVPVAPPDVNNSDLQYAASARGIRFGLGAVRNVGAPAVAAIVEARGTGPFTDYADFLTRVDLGRCGKQALGSLIEGGALDCLGHPRRALLEALEPAMGAAVAARRRADQGQYDLFAEEPGALTIKLGTREWSRKQLLTREREALGFYVSAHPLDGTEPMLRRRAPRSVGDLLADPPGPDTPLTVAGLVTGIQRKTSKAGKAWAVVTLEDVDGQMEVRLLSRVYEATQAHLAVDALIAVTGRTDDGEHGLRLLADDLTVLSPADALAEPLVIRLTVGQCTPELVSDLRSALAHHPGDREVRLRLAGREGNILLAIDSQLWVSPERELSEDLAVYGLRYGPSSESLQHQKTHHS